MEWQDCIEEAKEELGITGWTDNWGEVIELAKEKYWSGDSFKDLKEMTIEESNGKCALCLSNKKLTAHHIFYDSEETTICVCDKCHEIIHKKVNHYGFVLQLVLLYFNKPQELFDKYPNLANICCNCYKELNEEIKKNVI
jgi:hypothetical protein